MGPRHAVWIAGAVLALAACGNSVGGASGNTPGEASSGPCDPVAYYAKPSPTPTKQPPVRYTAQISQGQTLTRPLTVNQDQRTFAVLIAWQQGDVQLTLTSPSGVVYDRSTTDPAANHHFQANAESFAFDRPESGDWTASLFGARIVGSTERVAIEVDQIGMWEFGPIAYVVASKDRGVPPLRVEFSSANMTFEGATIVGYRWAFGDCSPIDTSATPTHVFANAGTYTVTVTVTDSEGQSDSASRDIHVCQLNLLPCLQ